jgi:hypothetical protein
MINYTNTAIVTFYDDKERYILAGNRQRESLESIGFPMENYFAFRNYGEFNSPSHNDIPYAFKPYAIQEMRKKGFETIIWMDSAVYAIKQLYEMLYYINLNGFIFFDNLGYTISDYTSDICMNNFDMSREEGFNHPMIMACLMGFNFKNQLSVKLFNEYYQAVNVYGNYEGDWNNNTNQVSKDNRVKGHRHDQSVMSLILAKHNIKPMHPHSTYFAYFGNPGHLPHAESVCLLSQGF